MFSQSIHILPLRIKMSNEGVSKLILTRYEIIALQDD